MSPRSFVPIVHGATESRPDELDTLEAAEAVGRALRELGYTTEMVHLDLDLTPLEDLARRRPLVVFNLAEAIHADLRLAPFVPATMDRLGLAYTGSRFEAMIAAMSKLRCKQMLKAAGIATPAWIDGGRCLLAADTTVLVKSDTEHASVGIDAGSVVPAARAREVIREREERHGGRFFAEAFVEGREFNVALLDGPGGPEVLPCPEIIFEDFPEGKPRIVDYDAKWLPDSFAYHKTPRIFGIERGDPKLARKLKRLALDCWRLFGISGYARVDFRVDAAGKPWVIDINTNPCITPDAGFAATAAEAGIGYPELIERVVQAAVPAERGEPAVEEAAVAERGELAEPLPAW